MKIYVYDRGWAGATVVIAENRNEAIWMINAAQTNNAKRRLTETEEADVTEHEIRLGIISDNRGDE